MKKIYLFIFMFVVFITGVDANTLSSIYIDGKSCQNDGTLDTCVSSETYSWNSTTKTLTLNNYNSGRIFFYSSEENTSNNEEITIHLKGNNVITERSGYNALWWSTGLDGKIMADDDASLVVNHERQEAEINVAIESDGKLTITGGKITVNNNYTVNTDTNYSAYGIEASHGIYISGKTDLKINVDSDYDRVFGIVVGGEGVNNPEIKIESPALVEMNLKARNKLNSDNKNMYAFGTITGTTGEVQYNITGTLWVNPILKSIYIDGKTCLNNGTMDTCVSSETYSWDSVSKTLTLNNYNGGRIGFNSLTDYAMNKEEITIYLKGNNVITERSGYVALWWSTGLDGKIMADDGASLVVNHERQEAENNPAVDSQGKLMITGGKITVNNNYTFNTDTSYSAYGVEASHGIYINGKTDLKINVNSDYARAYGIGMGGNNVTSPPFVMEYPAKLEIITKAKNRLNNNSFSSKSFYTFSGTNGEIIETFGGYENGLVIYAGDSVENASKLNSVPTDFGSYAYLKIESGEPNSNDNIDPPIVDNNPDKDGNVTKNPQTGNISIFIISLILICSLIVSLNMYRKNIENYD